MTFQVQCKSVRANTCCLTAIAWTQKGVEPRDVGDGGFKYAKIGSVANFFNWGLIELGPDQMKRTKNSRYMHMIFNVQSGVVEVRVHENEFVVRRMGIWQVPRGMCFSPLLLFLLLFSVFFVCPLFAVFSQSSLLFHSFTSLPFLLSGSLHSFHPPSPLLPSSFISVRQPSHYTSTPVLFCSERAAGSSHVSCVMLSCVS
jgi:hypothetical protein